MKHLFITLLLVSIVACKTDNKTEKSLNKGDIETTSSEKITVKKYTYETLEPILTKNDDKIYVINFWATWCKPCVEELPAFEKLHTEFKNNNVEVILVSLDFPNQIEKRVIPFIKKNNIHSKVVLMADPDQNTWIPKISEKWTGAIPATLIYTKNKREFYEQSFTYDLLYNELKKFQKTN